ncbi:MAG: fibronectin type III domain-containing protein, partial [Elusimicrobia bacterium]|nr:fibronectin type III domain-containing protein [Elusimicrobiota bacterium]
TSGLDSDYNDWFSSNTYNTIQWGDQTAQFSSGWLGKDAISIAANPFWADPSAGIEDFHPMSTAANGRYNMATGSFNLSDGLRSQTIDAGDPAEDVAIDSGLGLEPEDNGDRANLGSYGLTAQASKSCGASLLPTVTLSVLSSTITASWTAICPPDGGFDLQASTASNFTGALRSSATANGLSTSLSLFNLSPNTTYYVRLNAIRQATDNFSTVIETVTLAAIPGRLSFTGIGLNQFTVNWSTNGNPANTVYEASVSTDINFGRLVSSQTATSQSLTFTSLSASTTFFVRVRAYNWTGLLNSPSLGAVVTVAGVVTISANRLPGVWYNTAASLFFAQGASNFHYRINATANDTPTLADPIFDGSGLSLPLSSGANYFHVLGTDASDTVTIGEARFGPIQVDEGIPLIASIIARVSASDPTLIPDGGTTLSKNPRFSWSAPASISPIVGYSVSLSGDPSVEPGSSISTTLTFLDGSLSDAGLYHVKVRALNLAGTLGPSSGMSLRLARVPSAEGMTVRNNYFNPLQGGCLALELRNPVSGRTKIDIYTLLGQRVATLADADLPAGVYSYSWCGRNNANRVVASGVYLMHIQAPQQKRDVKIIIGK